MNSRYIFLPIALLMSMGSAFAELTSFAGTLFWPNEVVTSVNFREQNRDKVIQDINGLEYYYRYGMETWYGVFTIIPEYQHSFRNQRIAQCLFGSALVSPLAAPGITSATTCNTSCNTSCNTDCNSSCNTSCQQTILIQGSAVTGRNDQALLADNFYLAPDFNSAVTFNPQVRNVNLNFDFYFGFDEYVSGLYARFYFPVSWARWDLNAQEAIVSTGTQGYPAGYFTPGTMPQNTLLQSFLGYTSGEFPAPTTGSLTTGNPTPNPAITYNHGNVTFSPLAYGRILPCNVEDCNTGCDTNNNDRGNRRVGVPSVRWELGWNWWNCEDYNIGFNLQGAAPTGAKTDASLLFAPKIGNHFWEIGAGVFGHYCFWRSENEDVHFDLLVDANLTHFFGRQEQRTFDLVDKPLSRYMLAAKFGSPVVDNLKGGGATPSLQFQNVYVPVANLTADNITVNIPLQADIVVQFSLAWCNWNWDVGYNFWGRSCERISRVNCSNLLASNNATKWVLKGTADEFGFTTSSDFGVTNQAVGLSNSSSNATIFSGGTLDNPANATGGPGNVTLATSPAPATFVQSQTSVDPIFITENDVNYFVGTRGISHKVFSGLSYNWELDGCWSPYITVAGSAEFGQTPRNNCPPCPTTSTSQTTVTPVISNCANKTCIDCALTQWSVFVKLGVDYN